MGLSAVDLVASAACPVDDGGGGVESGELLAAEADGVGSDVFLQPLQAPGAGDAHDPGPLGEQLRERDLRWGGIVLGGDLADCVDDRLADSPPPLTATTLVRRCGR